MAASPAARRSARNARVTSALVCLALAAAVVATGVAVGTVAVLIATSLAALSLGALATRFTYLALADERRIAQADRTKQAHEYRVLAAERADENASVLATLQDRLTAEYELTHTLTAQVAKTRDRLEQTEVELVAARNDSMACAEIIVELEHRVVDLEAELAAWADKARTAEQAAEQDQRRLA